MLTETREVQLFNHFKIPIQFRCQFCTRYLLGVLYKYSPYYYPVLRDRAISVSIVINYTILYHILLYRWLYHGLYEKTP